LRRQVIKAAVMSMTPQVRPAQKMAGSAREAPPENDDGANVFMRFPTEKIGWAGFGVKSGVANERPQVCPAMKPRAET
jgi:hypothetical protein